MCFEMDWVIGVVLKCFLFWGVLVWFGVFPPWTTVPTYAIHALYFSNLNLHEPSKMKKW